MARVSTMLRVGLFAFVLGAMWWHAPPPAAACSCATLGDNGALLESAAVFTGEYLGSDQVDDFEGLTGREYPFQTEVSGSRLRFDVDRVFKGDVAVDQTVMTEPGGGMCGLTSLEPATRYLVFAGRESTGELSTFLCSGTRPVTDANPVDPGWSATRPASSAGDPEAAAVSAGSSSWTPTWWIVGASAVFLAAAVAVTLSRRRRVSAPPPRDR